MEFTFEQTFEDVLEFNRYHMRHSPAVRRSRLTIHVLAAGLGCIGFLAVAWFRGPPDPIASIIAVVVTIGIAVPLVFLRSSGVDRLEDWIRMRAVRKMLSEGENKGLIGRQRLVFGPAAIVSENEFVKTEYRYDAVERLAETDAYFYVYVGAVQALVIKKSLFADARQMQQFRGMFAK